MVSMESNDLFSRQKIHFQPADTIIRLLGRNNTLVVVLRNNTLLRIPLQNPQEQDEVSIPVNHGDKIEHCHLDPSGCHFLLSTSAGDVFYIHRSMKKAKPLTKLKGHVITAVGWNHQLGKELETSFVLLGTSRGLIFESSFQPVDERSATGKAPCIYLKQVYTLPHSDSDHSQVDGIAMHRCGGNEERWFVLISTPSQLYPFVGAANLHVHFDGVLSALFQYFTDHPARVHTLPGSSSTHSELHTFPGTCGEDPPGSFAWMVAPGVMYGPLDSAQSDPFKLTASEKLYKYPSLDGRGEMPIAMTLTEFHFMLLFPDRLIAVCTLNEQIVYEDVLGSKFGKLLGLSRDVSGGVVWVYTDRQVLKYKSANENKFVWKIFLQMGKYSDARKYAAHDPDSLNQVLQTHARKLFDERKYSAAAELFASSRTPFEEVALLFTEVNERDGLKVYLQRKLENIAVSEKTPSTMIVLWLIEIYLTEMVEAKTGAAVASLGAPPSLPPPPGVILPAGAMGPGGLSPIGVPSISAGVPEIKGFDQNKYRLLRDQFRLFLNKPIVTDCVSANCEAVYKIISSHGEVDSLLYLAELMKDYDQLMRLHVQQENFEGALKTIMKQEDPKIRISLFAKFSPQLFTNIPKRLVDAWISQGPILKPKRLLPALFEADQDPKQAAEAVRYLEHCVNGMGSTDPAIHNFLLAMYVKTDLGKVLTYLEKQGTDPQRLCYDPKYALRLCVDHKLDRACIFICTTMGLHEEAVRLALKYDVDLAKQSVKRVDDSEELRKKLWLCVARHVVEKEQDIKKCIELLQETEGVIKIQDILPFFPDFATIEHFKEPLCECLAEHSNKIHALQEEMAEATEAAEQIKRQTKALKNKCTVVKVRDKCASCGTPLMLRQFYAFPCRHNFHVDCIERELVPFLSAEDAARAKELRRQMAARPTVDDSSSVSSMTSSQATTGLAGGGSDVLANELDDLLGSNCVYCADYTIRLLDQPFFTPAEYMRQLKAWE